MKARYVIFLLILPYLAQAILACTEEDPLCDPGIGGAYKLESITALHLEHGNNIFNVTSSTEIAKSSYGVLVNFKRQFTTTSMTQPSNRFSIFSSAYACSPPEDYPLDTLTDFKITALQKFDDTHEAGADISDAFEIVDADTVKTLHDYVNYFGSSLEHQRTTLTLVLKTLPNNAGPFEFKFKVSLKDGRTLEVTTTPIKLTE